MRNQVISFKAKPESVDMENRVLKNVILAKVGEAKGHGMCIEQKFIDDMVALAANGVRSNFGHNWNNLGLQLGRVQGVKTNGDMAIGDLYIYANADSSPRVPQMGTWVMNQAKEDPESLMLSISFKPSYYYQLDDEGKEIQVQEDWWGDFKRQFDDRPVYVAIAQLYSVDVVDSGALTEKMFNEGEKQESKGFFHAIMQYFKGNNQSDNMENNTIDLGNKGGNGTSDGGYVWVGGKQFKAEEVATAFNELTALKSSEATLRTQFDAQTARITELEAENVELKAKPADTLTNGETGASSSQKTTMSASEKFNAAINASLTPKK
jgi:hypothetical protein